ncbi:MAG: PepSY-associated TM helix domain-containing protein [Bacteroidota bacterium]
MQEDLNVDAAIAKIDSVYNFDFSRRTNLYFPTEESPVVMVYGQQLLEDSTYEFAGAYYSPINNRIQDGYEPLTTVGDTMYVLHYFGQIPTLGLYLSGLVALFFLFASVTGILIHWKNLLTKFYAFIKEGKWKQIWTNAHTVLGVIGLPFQIVYAVTGAFFGLLSLLLIPTVFLQYDGNVDEVYSKISPFESAEFQEDAPFSDNLSLLELRQLVVDRYPEHDIHYAQMYNYQREDGKILFGIDDHKGLSSSGEIVLSMKDGEVLEEYSQFPNEKNYSNSVLDYMSKLHFASFGGYYIKIIYFILALITCFMIISGVLIWRTARDNKKYSYKQRLFHHRVTKFYLAICLALFPAFAILFLANKLVPMEMEARIDTVNAIFFLSWLALTVIGLFWNKYSQQNRNYLIIGGLLSLLVPVFNGVVTGGWIWNMWNSYHWVAYIDMFWLFTGLTALYLAFFVLKVKPTSDKPEEIAEKEEEVVVKKPLPKKLPKKLIRKPVLNIKASEKGLNLGET